MDELTSVATVKNPSLVLITESWLPETVSNTAISIGNAYNLYRLDRKSPGDGVLVYVNSSIPTERITTLEEEGKEVLWLFQNLIGRLDNTARLLCLWCIISLGSRVRGQPT